MEPWLPIVIIVVLVGTHYLFHILGKIEGLEEGFRKGLQVRILNYLETSQRTQPSGTRTQERGSDNTE